MTCPKCANRMRVTNSEEVDGFVVRRRRQCTGRACKVVVVTHEHVEIVSGRRLSSGEKVAMKIL